MDPYLGAIDAGAELLSTVDDKLGARVSSLVCLCAKKATPVYGGRVAMSRGGITSH